MKRITLTTAHWIANVIDAEDRAIRKRARLDPLPPGSAYSDPSISAYAAATALYGIQNERDQYMEDR